MKHEKLANALNEINEEYIAEAMQSKKRSPWRWVSAVAALLAVAITAFVVIKPLTGEPAQLAYHPTAPAATTPKWTLPEITHGAGDTLAGYYPAQNLLGQVSAPAYPLLSPYPNSSDGMSYDDDAYHAWRVSQAQQYDQPAGYADSLDGYFRQSIPALLDASRDDNPVCSPANIYMALAMLAEATDGETRQEILTLLGADSIESLRTQAGHFWNAHYKNDGAVTCLLANSLWLDQAYPYNQATADLLAKDYYASVFCGDLGSDEMNRSLQSWLNENTGGLLKEQASQVELDPNTAMALASTLYYRAKWTGNFSVSDTAPDIFHAPDGDVTRDFMHTTLLYGPYYYGQDYSAVPLGLEGGAKMWLILPDEGQTPESILASGHALGDILGGREDNAALVRVNLALPKFDVTGNMDLTQPLQALGIADVFGVGADFSPILPNTDAYLSSADHAARVKIDEEGVEAAAYTVMVFAGAAMPPSEEVDFTLDRPFVFLITNSDGSLPLFAGIVNNP